MWNAIRHIFNIIQSCNTQFMEWSHQSVIIQWISIENSSVTKMNVVFLLFTDIKASPEKQFNSTFNDSTDIFIFRLMNWSLISNEMNASLTIKTATTMTSLDFIVETVKIIDGNHLITEKYAADITEQQFELQSDRTNFSESLGAIVICIGFVVLTLFSFTLLTDKKSNAQAKREKLEKLWIFKQIGE